VNLDPENRRKKYRREMPVRPKVGSRSEEPLQRWRRPKKRPRCAGSDRDLPLLAEGTALEIHGARWKPAQSPGAPRSFGLGSERLPGEAAQGAACQRNPQPGPVKQVYSRCPGQAAKLHIKISGVSVHRSPGSGGSGESRPLSPPAPFSAARA